MSAPWASSFTLLKIAGLALAAVMTCADVAIAAGGVYQWTDGKGVVHFTDDPGKIPKKFHHTVLELRPPEKENGPKTAPSENEEEGDQSESASRPESPSQSESSVKSPPVPSEAVDGQGHTREWWRERVQEWEKRRTDAQANLADAQARLGHERFLNATTGNMERIQDISAEVSKYEAEVREAEDMLTDGLPDEARKAQAPPGWLRD